MTKIKFCFCSIRLYTVHHSVSQWVCRDHIWMLYRDNLNYFFIKKNSINWLYLFLDNIYSKCAVTYHITVTYNNLSQWKFWEQWESLLQYIYIINIIKNTYQCEYKCASSYPTSGGIACHKTDTDTVSYQNELADESIALKTAWKSCSTTDTEKTNNCVNGCI